MATQFGPLNPKERTALMEIVHRMKSALPPDHSQEGCQVLLGMVQGILDLIANQRAYDKWEREQIANWNEGYALGYREGTQNASTIVKVMRDMKRFGFGTPGVDTTKYYGREGMRRAQG